MPEEERRERGAVDGRGIEEAPVVALAVLPAVKRDPAVLLPARSGRPRDTREPARRREPRRSTPRLRRPTRRSARRGRAASLARAALPSARTRQPVAQTCATSTPTTATRYSQGGASPSRRPVAWPRPRKSSARAVEPPNRRRSARRLKSQGRASARASMLARGLGREALAARARAPPRPRARRRPAPPRRAEAPRSRRARNGRRPPARGDGPGSREPGRRARHRVAPANDVEARDEIRKVAVRDRKVRENGRREVVPGGGEELRARGGGGLVREGQVVREDGRRRAPCPVWCVATT